MQLETLRRIVETLRDECLKRQADHGAASLDEGLSFDQRTVSWQESQYWYKLFEFVDLLCLCLPTAEAADEPPAHLDNQPERDSEGVELLSLETASAEPTPTSMSVWIDEQGLPHMTYSGPADGFAAWSMLQQLDKWRAEAAEQIADGKKASWVFPKEAQVLSDPHPIGTALDKPTDGFPRDEDGGVIIWTSGEVEG